MIGILIDASQHNVVEEFFQLFKTPWELFRPGKKYDVLITDQTNAIDPRPSLTIIIAGKQSDEVSWRTGKPTDIVKPIAVVEGKGFEFPIYTGVTNVTGGDRLFSIKQTGQWAACLSIEDGQSTIQLGYNFFAEAKHMLQHGQPLQYGHIPSLDIHIANLREWIVSAGCSLIEIPPCSYGSPFFACLTHDVDFAGIKNHKFDHTMAGFLYRAILVSFAGFLRGRYSLRHLLRNWCAAASLPLVFTGLMKDFWFQFRRYTEIEKECHSTFYLVPFKDHAGDTDNGAADHRRAVKYEVAAIKNEIDHLLHNGFEIGIHGLDGWRSLKSAQAERSKIQSLAGQGVYGVRMHWLFGKQDTPSILEQAGYKYDTTWGYNEKPGYRAGTHQVFRPLGAKTLLELPMHVMDTALFYPHHLDLTFEQGLQTIRQYTEAAAAFGGVLTFNWHHRSIAPERLWGGVYRETLRELKRRGAQFGTASTVVDWFEQRRRISFEQIKHDADAAEVNISTTGEKHAANMTLRVYQSHSRASATNARKHFKDYPLQKHQTVQTRF